MSAEQIRKLRRRMMEVLGRHVEKYRHIFIVVTAIVAALELFFIIYWNVDNKSEGVAIDNVYLGLYIALFVISLFNILVLFLNIKRKISPYVVAFILHIYAFLIVAWATAIAILDIRDGLSPIIYLSICMFVAGILVIEPVYFTLLVIISTTTIIVVAANNNFNFFKNQYDIFNLVIYMIFVVSLAFRHFRVTIREARTINKLEELTYNDQLTGLLNERSYFMECDRLNEVIEKKEPVKFGVFVMDVNNVKATNDVHGHRFGCHLIVTGGHKLPEIFKTSQLFHVGGDEFIAIIYGEDLEKMDETIKRFDETLQYQMIEFEGKEIILSLARGYAIYEEGLSYKEVFQKADNAMYENKVMVKEKYHLAKR